MTNFKKILTVTCMLASAAAVTACSHSKDKMEPAAAPVASTDVVDTSTTYSAAPANLGASSSGQGR